MPFHGGTRKIIFVIDKNGSVKSREFRNRVGSGLFKLPEYDGRTNMLCFYSCYKVTPSPSGFVFGLVTTAAETFEKTKVDFRGVHYP